ncbi:MAG: DsrE family protein [Aquificaceae bacterium]|nr:DsrE family protein [Aquificaceae bacterium]MCX7990166.1 DsrE family protein [Aquificaceae bacterium]MDW8295079.1 DsrE family protein [Aquificaceae bacterium]
MKVKVSLVLGLMFVSAMFAVGYASPKKGEKKDKDVVHFKDNISVLINITTDKGQNPMMALNFAMTSLKRGNETIVWLNSEGVKLADAKARPTPAIEQLKEFIKQGGLVFVCPRCAEQFKVKELVQGAEFASPGLIFGILSEDRVRILNW